MSIFGREEFRKIIRVKQQLYPLQNNTKHENRAGFWKGYSCADNLFTLFSFTEMHKK
jgi:hypothetical protein